MPSSTSMARCLILPLLVQWAMVTAVWAAPITWEFSTPGAAGQAPAGWQDASQAMSPPPTAPGPYQATSFDGRGVMLFKTAGNTSQRPKIRTQQVFQTGITEWLVYIPPMEANARVSLGAFLYSDQSGAAANAAREIDFEIGPGRASVRAGIPNLPADALLVYLTVQPDNAAGRSGDPGSSLIFQPSDPAHHVRPGNWYLLTIELNEDQLGRYVVDWYIEREGGPRIKARPTYTCAYGPSNAYPTTFRIYNSLENLNFMGDALPTRDHFVYFDRTSHLPFNSGCADAPTTPQLITDMESDIAIGNFPLGAPGEWTRFGAAYNGMSITTTPAEVDRGAKSLRATANFAAGQNFGVRYRLPTSPLTLPCAVTLTWRMRTNQPGSQRVRFVLLDSDGDIWITNSLYSPTAEWTTYGIPFGAPDFTIAEVNGNGQFDASLQGIGFDFLANGTSATTASFFLDEIYWESANVTEPVDPVGSWMAIR
jgi:hypothetical protein